MPPAADAIPLTPDRLEEAAQSLPPAEFDALVDRLVALRARRHREDYSSDPFEVEHILPLDAGGTDAADNLAYACRGCNGLKSALTEATDAATGHPAALFHPRRDLWPEDFACTPDFTEVRGLTPVGRATVEALALNREGLRNLRAALHPLGVHPPAEDAPTTTAIP